MKKAPFVGLVAVGLLVATFALTERVPTPDRIVALDFAGIDTLVLAGDSVNVHIGRDEPLQAKFSSHGERNLQVRRDGRTLYVRLVGKGAGDLRVFAPPSLRVIELTAGDIETKAHLEALEVRVGSRLDWNGPVDALRLRQMTYAGETCAARRGCMFGMTIDASDVRRVDAALATGTVSLDDPRILEAASLALGEKADYAIHDAHRVLAIAVAPLDVATLPRARLDVAPWKKPARAMQFD
jgi:hypothetical protein